MKPPNNFLEQLKKRQERAQEREKPLTLEELERVESALVRALARLEDPQPRLPSLDTEYEAKRSLSSTLNELKRNRRKAWK